MPTTLAQTGAGSALASTLRQSTAAQSADSASRKILSTFSDDWQRLRTQKSRMRGGVEARILLNLCMYFGEQYAQQIDQTVLTDTFAKDDDLNKLHLVFNLHRRAVRRKIGRIWGAPHTFYATPNTTDPRAYDRADVANKVIRGLDFTLNEKSLLWTKLFWMAIGGVAIEHIPWIPDAKLLPTPQYDPASGELLFVDQADQNPDGSPILLPQSAVTQIVSTGAGPAERFQVHEAVEMEGEIGAEIIDPLRFFIDNSITSVSKLQPGQACYIAEIKTVDWVTQQFGSDVGKAFAKAKGNKLNIISTHLIDRGPSVAGTNLLDLVPAIQGSRSQNDPDMAIFLTRYEPPSNDHPYGRCTYLTPGVTVLHDGEIAYGSMPLVDTHWEARSTCFFSGDFATDLNPPQKFLNKRFSQMGEAANAQLYEVLLLGQGLSKDDIPSDMPGSIPDGLDENGNAKVRPMERGILHPWFLESIRMVSEFFEHIGGSDLTSVGNRFNYLRGTNGLPILQEILDSEDGPFYSHFGDQEAVVRFKRLERVSEFYPPQRTLHYTGPDLKDETLEFYKDYVFGAGFDYTITIDQGSLLPEMAAVREAKVIARLSSPLAILYTNRRTGKLDSTRIANELKYTDRERESREAQARKLARQLLARVMNGEPLPEGIPLPTWDHDAMMDEYDSVMTTMEFLEASPQTRQLLAQLYEAHRTILSGIQEAQQKSVENHMIQGAMMQAAQQTAAQTASNMVEQTTAQLNPANQMPPGETETQLRDMLGKGPAGQGAARPQIPKRPAVPGPGPQRQQVGGAGTMPPKVRR